MSEHHRCELKANKDQFVPTLLPDATICDKICLKLLKIRVASISHPEILKYLKSENSILVENRKLLEEKTKFIIHPFSLFRKYWEIFIFFVYMFHVFVNAFFIGMFPHLYSHDDLMDRFLCVDLVLWSLLLLEFLLKFRTGFLVEETNEIELNPTVIAMRYWKKFIFDIFWNFPLVLILQNSYFDDFSESGTRLWYTYISMAFFFNALYVYRLKDVEKYFSSLTANFKWSEKKNILFTLMFRTIWLWHLVACYRILFQLPEATMKSYFGFKDAKEKFFTLYNLSPSRRSLFSNMTFPQPRFEKFKAESGITKKYISSILVTLKVALQAGYSTSISDSPYNMLMTSLIMVLGWIYFSYTLIIIMNLITTSETSRRRYQEMACEIKVFADSKFLSRDLKEKLLKNHKYKYQGHYFKEGRIDTYTPENLKKEFLKYSCASLLSQTLLKKVSNTLLESIMKYLKMEIFFRNDIVFKVGSQGLLNF